jgi:hypothetical protein
MKIQVLKKASTKMHSSDPCPFLVEIPPEAAKK